MHIIKASILPCYLGLLAFLSLNPWLRPPSGASFFSWDKIIHILAYAVLTVLVFFIWNRRLALFTNRCLLVWLAAATGSFVIGFLLEIAQTLLTPSRSGSGADSLANGIGAFILPTAFAIWRRRSE